MTVFVSSEGKSVTDRTSIEHPETILAQLAHLDSEIATDDSPVTARATVGISNDVASSLPLVGESVAFTGTLASMTHREAIRLVEQFGESLYRDEDHISTAGAKIAITALKPIFDHTE